MGESGYKDSAGRWLARPSPLREFNESDGKGASVLFIRESKLIEVGVIMHQSPFSPRVNNSLTMPSGVSMRDTWSPLFDHHGSSHTTAHAQSARRAESAGEILSATVETRCLPFHAEINVHSQASSHVFQYKKLVLSSFVHEKCRLLSVPGDQEMAPMLPMYGVSMSISRVALPLCTAKKRTCSISQEAGLLALCTA